jgi:ABC-type amino acid transport substrate-binding protein
MLNFRRLLLVPCLLCLGVSSQAQTLDVLEKIRSEKKVVVAHRESSVPFSYVKPDKQPVGYAIDICLKLVDAVKKNLGMDKLDVEFLQVTPANRIEVIKTGAAQLECGSTTNNAKRREDVAFTIPHFIAGARFMVRTDSAVKRSQDLRNLKVVSTANTTPLAAAKRQVKPDILEAADHKQAMAMVENNEAAAFVMDDVLLFGLIASAGKAKDLKVVGNHITTEAYAIMLPKEGGEAFKKVIDSEMRRLIQSQEIHALYKKWFQAPIPPNGATLNMPMGHFLKDYWKYPTDYVPSF